MTTDPATEALAEAWASIDGKLDAFTLERSLDLSYDDPTYTGHYEGYMAEAAEMIVRLKRRGFVVIPDPNPAEAGA